jgi:intracellular sulfur oxidation DsrE/DsrF family protein
VDSNTVIVVNGDGMGQAETALTHKLMTGFLGVLETGGHRPGAILFYAAGVKLTVAGSPVLEELTALSAEGVELLVCTTCLNHFGIYDDLAVGIAGGMKEIVDRQAAAAKVITL